MSKSMHQQEAPAAPDEGVDDPKAGLTRRTVLAGAVATTATAAIGVEAPAAAQDALSKEEKERREDLDLFLTLSAALTGIARVRLSPRADPLGIKEQYFNRASGRPDKTQDIDRNEKRKAEFDALKEIAKRVNLQAPDEGSGDGIIKQGKVNELVGEIDRAGDVKYLARSIVLMWYLGSWYEPAELKRLATPGNSNPFIDHEVISPAAYTNGFVWRVAQAHPMGYSDMQFGYWTYEPQRIDQFFQDRTPKGRS